MTDLEFDILDTLYRAPQRTLTTSELSKNFASRVVDMRDILEKFKQNGIIKQEVNSQFVSLSHPTGTVEYLTESHRRNDRRQMKRREWIYAVIGALIAGLIGFLFDLLVLVLV